MNRPWIGWTLAALALAAGWAGYGWRGMVLGATVIVFWLLLQFSRSLRVMQRAGRSPMGRTASAVMLQAKLAPGMTLLQVLPLAGSLGEAVGDAAAETWRWRDNGGAAVTLVFARGRLQSWSLARPARSAAPDGASESAS